MPGKNSDPIACFSCGEEFYYGDSTKIITDKELPGYYRDSCLWADMCQETSSVPIRLINDSMPLEQEFETDSSLYQLSPLSSLLYTANRILVETTSDLSSLTSADSLYIRSDNTPLLY
jgi:hypothetical protein